MGLGEKYRVKDGLIGFLVYLNVRMCTSFQANAFEKYHPNICVFFGRANFWSFLFF